LLKYDSVHGVFGAEVKATEKSIVVNGKEIEVTAIKNPSELPHAANKVDLVMECTGLFTAREKAENHLKAGGPLVLISAPAKGADITIAYGINHEKLDKAKHKIISNASCTTNCLAPVAKVLHQRFGIEKGLMVTIHAYTADQGLVDAPHKDLRRARAGALSMIPTSTGAARAIGLVMPELKGKLDGYAMRVPTPDVSAVDLSVELKSKTDEASLNAAVKEAAAGPLKGILEYCDEPLVSVDFTGNTHSSIFDAKSTKVMGGTFAKVLAWYDNEMGYATRVADLAIRMGN
jgi:glyceraldehyde 3-phosphate dehydrogenase